MLYIPSAYPLTDFLLSLNFPQSLRLALSPTYSAFYVCSTVSSMTEVEPDSLTLISVSLVDVTEMLRIIDLTVTRWKVMSLKCHHAASGYSCSRPGGLGSFLSHLKKLLHQITDTSSLCFFGSLHPSFVGLKLGFLLFLTHTGRVLHLSKALVLLHPCSFPHTFKHRWRWSWSGQRKQFGVHVVSRSRRYNNQPCSTS